MHEQVSLFSKSELSNNFEIKNRQIAFEINSFSSDYLLSIDLDEVCAHIVDQYIFDTLEIFPDKKELIEQGETTVPNREFGRVFDLEANFYIFSIPFAGDSSLFCCRASTYTFSPKPCGSIRGNELHLRFTDIDNNADKIKEDLDEAIKQIKMYVGWINDDIGKFNNNLKPAIEGKLRERKEKLLKDQGVVASLGIPIRQRKDASKTFIAPVTRKKIHIPKPKTSTTPYKPEPELEVKVYEQILDTLQNMSLVMERSPHVFIRMCEEDIRTLFLVHLNDQYKGQATGETFNCEGKTDILIRVDGKNIFIAECKFWDGPKSITATIDQLLGYLTWRDTKVALLIFNRNKDLSKVLSQIPDIVRAHPNYKGGFEQKKETEFRFVLKSKVDDNQELISTILVFDIPKQ
jgi:hypothetical protein